MKRKGGRGSKRGEQNPISSVNVEEKKEKEKKRGEKKSQNIAGEMGQSTKLATTRGALRAGSDLLYCIKRYRETKRPTRMGTSRGKRENEVFSKTAEWFFKRIPMKRLKRD